MLVKSVGKNMLSVLKMLYSLLILLIMCQLLVCLNIKEVRKKRNVPPSVYDKSIYSFNGFEKIASVPVLFPNDICMLNVNDVHFAVTLHTHRSGNRQFTVFRRQNASYEIFAEIPAPNAINMDCLSYKNRGYIALAYNITEHAQQADDTSPVYELTENNIRTVQYFSAPHLSSVYLCASGNEQLFMLQSYMDTNQSQQFCPYYKWSGSTFDLLGSIPCSNAKHLEPFSMNYEQYVAVANYADRYGRTTTNSVIYKYSREKTKFLVFQKIRTHGATDVRYFTIPNENMPNGWQHFLLFANTLNENNQLKNAPAESVFYSYDQTSFVPYQSISLHAVEQFLPVENMVREKFLLLVSCANQDMRIYNFNNWKFEESQVQFTEGALSKGVAQMRMHQEQEDTYLVIANNRMLANETNIFRPIFRQEESANELRQEIIDWTAEQLKRLSKIGVNKLMQNVETKLMAFEKNSNKSQLNAPKNVDKSNIVSVETKSLIYPRLSLNGNFWKVLSFANQGLDALQIQLDEQYGRTKRDVINDKKLNVKTLKVENKLMANRINGVKTSQPTLTKIKANKVIVNKIFEMPTNSSFQHKNDTNQLTELEELNVKDLKLTGKFNNFNWHEDLVKMTLKRNASHQFVKSDANIGHLQAEAVIVNNEKINNFKIPHLVSTQSGSYVIDQNIQFAAPIEARELQINERLNNIHVLHGKLDVLLRNSNVTQVIEGPKRFDNIKILEPITLSGQMSGQQLDSLIPVKVIKHNLKLNGDFIIEEDVDIGKILSVDDIILKGVNISAYEILKNGIIMSEDNSDDLDIEFQQPISANASTVSFVNDKDLQNLLRTHTKEVQVIEGHKIMPTNVTIKQGHAEVKILNGIDVDSLNNQLLLKDSNQTICAAMHLANVLTMGINATRINLSGNDLQSLLTKSTNQQIKGNLKVANLSVGKLNTSHLNANGEIFNVRVSEIYEHKTKNAPNRHTFGKNVKFYGNMMVENLKMPMKTDINGRQVETIERQMSQLNGNIKYVGDFRFNYPMNVSMLQFEGKLNDITTEDFGVCWLQRNATQKFTAPQNCATFTCPAGILLHGKLNGHEMRDFTLRSYKTNRNEFLPNVQLLQSTQIEGNLNANYTNGLQIPNDMLLKYSSNAQVIVGSGLSVQGDVFMQEGKSMNAEVINGLHLRLLYKFLAGQLIEQSLHVENAHFNHTPLFMTLNGYNLNDLLNNVWMLNEDKHLENIEISEAHFMGLMDFEGTLNGIDLRYLKENYFSLTQPQQILSQFVFNTAVCFAHNIDIVNIQLLGKLIEHKSHDVFAFDEFVAKSLKISGFHEISHKWHINDAFVNGDLLNVLINQLNFAQDLLRNDLAIQEISVVKNLNRASVKKLYVPDAITVNNVAIAKWLRNAVFVYENHNIRGVTTIDTVNIYKDLIVHGQVNNMIFNDGHLMLRDRPQTIHGDVFIRNAQNNGKVLASNFDTLHTNTINGVHVNRFFNNLGHMDSTAKVNGHLIFTQPMMVEEYQSTNRKRDASSLNCNCLNANTDNLMENLQELTKASQYTIDHFEIRQILEMNASKKIIPFTLHKGGKFLDVIGILNKEESLDHLNFFYWKEKQQVFTFDEELSWLPHDDYLTNLFELGFVNADYLLDEKTLNLSDQNQTKVISNNTKGFQEVLKLKKQNNVARIKLQGKDCNVVYGPKMTSVLIYCFMIDDEAQLDLFLKTEIPRNDVQQIIELSNSSVGLLRKNVLEIWKTQDEQPSLVQEIPAPNAKYFAVQKYDENNMIYLAVISSHENSEDAIEIFSSKDAQIFEHRQSILNVGPKQVEFSSLAETKDLLLFVRTGRIETPLLIYQYKGILNFEAIVTTSSLPLVEHLQLITLKTAGRHFIVIVNEKQITFVEIVLKLI